MKVSHSARAPVSLFQAWTHFPAAISQRTLSHSEHAALPGQLEWLAILSGESYKPELCTGGESNV